MVDAVVHYYTHVSANIHRGKHMLSEEASSAYEHARAVVAQLLNARADSVVFTANTTAGLNLVAAGLRLSPDDLVLVPLDAHHSNLLPWRLHAQVALVRLHADATIDLDHYAELLERRPKVVALNHCSNVTGLYAPVAEMARLAKAAGAVVVVDAAQSMPHRRLDVEALGADFVAFSAHKMLGPTGIGVLCAGNDALAMLEPSVVGGGTVDWVDVDGERWRRAPHLHEGGTPHVAGAYGLTAAVEYLNRLGWDAVARHDAGMAATLYEEASSRPWLRVVGGDATTERAGIVSFSIDGCPSLEEIARSLSDSYGVMCRSGHLCAQPLVDHFTEGEVLRISTYVYNDADEIRTAFDSLEAILRVSGILDRAARVGV